MNSTRQSNNPTPTETMLEELITEYTEQYPESEPPMSWFSAVGMDGIIEKLENRKGRRIDLLRQPTDQEDGGLLVYVDA